MSHQVAFTPLQSWHVRNQIDINGKQYWGWKIKLYARDGTKHMSKSTPSLREQKSIDSSLYFSHFHRVKAIFCWNEIEAILQTSTKSESTLYSSQIDDENISTENLNQLISWISKIKTQFDSFSLWRCQKNSHQLLLNDSWRILPGERWHANMRANTIVICRKLFFK